MMYLDLKEWCSMPSCSCCYVSTHFILLSVLCTHYLSKVYKRTWYQLLVSLTVFCFYCLLSVSEWDSWYVALLGLWTFATQNQWTNLLLTLSSDLVVLGTNSLVHILYNRKFPATQYCSSFPHGIFVDCITNLCCFFSLCIQAKNKAVNYLQFIPRCEGHTSKKISLKRCNVKSGK